MCRRLYCQTSAKLPRSILTGALHTGMFVESVYKKRRLPHLDRVDHSIPTLGAVRTTKGHKSSGTSLFVRFKILWLSSMETPSLKCDMFVLGYYLFSNTVECRNARHNSRFRLNKGQVFFETSDFPPRMMSEGGLAHMSPERAHSVCLCVHLQCLFLQAFAHVFAWACVKAGESC